jgi:hypothetical protein
MDVDRLIIIIVGIREHFICFVSFFESPIYLIINVRPKLIYSLNLGISINELIIIIYIYIKKRKKNKAKCTVVLPG